MRPYGQVGMFNVEIPPSSPYESPLLRAVTGTTIRPGGLALTERGIALCRFPSGARLLDVGCGAGATVEHLRSRYGFAAAGVDISRKLIAEGLLRNPALPLAEGAAEALPLDAAALDGVLCECVLSLLAEPRRALEQFHRVLRPDGYLILSDMYDRNPAGGTQLHEVSSEGSPRGEVARDMLESLLTESGFALCFWEDHTPLLKELAARLMLAYGSLEGLWCPAGGAGCAGARPGYYLLVARKKPD